MPLTHIPTSTCALLSEDTGGEMAMPRWAVEERVLGSSNLSGEAGSALLWAQLTTQLILSIASSRHLGPVAGGRIQQ